MANRTFKDVIIVLDNASGSTARIQSYLNSHTINGALTLLDQAGFGTENGTFLPGLHNGRLTLSGWLNSTTEAIIGPLIGQQTTITKTFGINRGVKWLKGEAWPQNAQMSGSPNTIEAFSIDLDFEGALTYNSTAPS